MTVREWIRVIALIALAWFLYRSARRHDMKRALLSILGVVAVVLFGLFIVYYGKFWHLWIFPVRGPAASG